MKLQKKRPRPTWLELPPVEVITRIAAFLCAREHTHSALILAEHSDQTRRAVATALEYRLLLDTSNHLHAARWALIFYDSLRNLNISAALPFNADYVRFVRSPSIHTLSIPPHAEYLDAISGSSSLRDLTVTFVGNVLASPGLARLVKVLSTLQISNLSLVSESSYVPSLFQNLFTAFHRQTPLADLGKSCAHVHTLHIAVKLWTVRQLLPVLKGFEKLRHLTLSSVFNSGQVDGQLTHFLGQLDTVQLYHVCSAPELAADIGKSVTALQHRTMPLRDLRALALCCPNIEVLEIELENGQEAAIGGFVSQVHTLRLRWQYDQIKGFYTPDAGVLLEIVKGATRLKELRVMDVEVSLTEASSMMQVVGKRLRCFGFPLTCKSQTAMQTLTCLAQVGARHNPELEELCPYGRDEIFSAHHWGWEPQRTDPHDESVLWNALHSLHRNAPRLRAGELDRLARLVMAGTAVPRTTSSVSL